MTFVDRHGGVWLNEGFVGDKTYLGSTTRIRSGVWAVFPGDTGIQMIRTFKTKTEAAKFLLEMHRGL